MALLLPLQQPRITASCGTALASERSLLCLVVVALLLSKLSGGYGSAISLMTVAVLLLGNSAACGTTITREHCLLGLPMAL